MADASPKRRADTPHRLPLPEQVALVLQGGGALGAYQAGVVEGLAETSIGIDWVAGISIGAINAAIVAGNPPEQRVAKLRSFWEKMSSGLPDFWVPPDDRVREMLHMFSAGFVATNGVPGFFAPRPVPPMLAMPETLEALSFYDSAPLVETLDTHVDWDLVNSGAMRLSVGAVHIETGNFRFFDTTLERLDARHVMASGALPPGLPPVEIDGEWWWDGGVVSNTPLGYVLDNQTEDMLLFQVDLFPARGPLPHTIVDVYSREKDIRYSSRTRQVTDQLLRLRRERQVIRDVLKKLPKGLCDDPDVKALIAVAEDKAVNVVHLIYRQGKWEGGSRDFEFSRQSMLHHWEEGRRSVRDTMSNDELLARNILDGNTAAFDLTNHR